MNIWRWEWYLHRGICKFTFCLLLLILGVGRKLLIFIDITAAAVCINDICDVQNDKHRQVFLQNKPFFNLFFWLLSLLYSLALKMWQDLDTLTCCHGKNMTLHWRVY